jgi:hypothetical protein
MLTLIAMIYDMSFLHMLNLVSQFVMIYILVLIWKLPKIPIIQMLDTAGLSKACWGKLFLL